MNIPQPLEHPMCAHTLMSFLAADIGKVSLFLGDIQQIGVAWPLKKVVCTYDCTQCQYECEVKAQNTYQYLTYIDRCQHSVFTSKEESVGVFQPYNG